MKGVSVNKLYLRINKSKLKIIGSKISKVLLGVNNDFKLYKLNLCEFSYKNNEQKLYDKICKCTKCREINNIYLFVINKILEFGRDGSC